MDNLHIQSFFRVEALFQGGVIAGELGLGGGLGREHEVFLRLREKRKREGQEECQEAFHRLLSAVTPEEFVHLLRNPFTAQVVGVTGQEVLLEVLVVLHQFGNDLQ